MKYIQSTFIAALFLALLNGCNADNKTCESPKKHQNSTVENGVKLSIEITRCSNENLPIKIKSVVTNKSNFPVIYRVHSIGYPAINTTVSNKDFAPTMPTNKSDPPAYSAAIDYGTLKAGEKIIRETTWDNKLSVGFFAPNGDYKISAHFTQVPKAHVYDDNVTRIKTSLVIKKQHAESFITPKDAMDETLKDTAITHWLDAHEGILCTYNLTYKGGQWVSSNKSDDDYYEQSQSGKICRITLKPNKKYTFYLADKFYSPSEIEKEINALK